jgi:hypothetical protein
LAALGLTVPGWPGWAVQDQKPDEKKEDKEAAKWITPEAQKAIDAGLKYLVENQHADGSFGTGAYKGNTAVTGLGALALLAGGHVPDAGTHAKAASLALYNVLSQEDPKQPGFLSNPRATPHGPMYGHGYAALFLAKIHGQLKDKKRADKVGKALERAVALIVKCQNREGGWRYLPVSQDADLSVTACQVAALAAAQEGGIEVPKRTLEKAVEYVKKCQDLKSGGFRYMRLMVGVADGKTAFARTAAGVASLYAAGVTKGPEIEKGVAFLLKYKPEPARLPDMYYFYGHYYAVQALARAGGDAWKEWYPYVRKQLLERQDRDGSWMDRICKHYGTAVACIVLQAPNGRLAPKPRPKE